MRNEIIGKAAVDLLSIPHLIFRMIRRNFILSSFSDIDKDVKFPHIEIMALLKGEVNLRITDICDRLQIAKAQMTYLIDKLVELELVERKTDTEDRRILNISMTEKGRIFYNNREKDITNAVLEYMAVLSDKEIETLTDSLNNLRDILLKLQ
jgi:DNA-binding MarR family transcriptional regulator